MSEVSTSSTTINTVPIIVDTSGDVVSDISLSDQETLQNQADMLALFGDEALLLETRLQQFQAEEKIKAKEKAERAVQVQASPDEKVASKVAKKTGLESFDKYQQWLIDGIHEMHESLIGLYGIDNVSIEEKYKFSEYEKRMINDENTSRADRFSSDVRSLLGREAVQFVILFPEIHITNSKGNKHTIRDLYISLHITCMLRFQGGFRGLRGKKSLSEHHSAYGHSHMSRGSAPNGTQGFCLGHTDFSTLVAKLTSDPFDINRFELFAVQLKDYLAWESLEGGPYVRISEIKLNDSRSNGLQLPSQTNLASIYTSFLRKFENVDIQVEDTGYNLIIKVNKDKDFWDKVTSVTPEVYRFPYDAVKGITYQPPPDESHLYNQIVSLNKQLINQEFGLKFKGLNVKTQIEVPVKPEEDKKDYMAHESVKNYIATQLEAKFNEHLQNEFCKS